MRKILMLCRLFWPHKGGVERHVYELSKQLLKQKCSITIITEQHESSLPLQETYEGLEILRIPQTALISKPALWAEMKKLTKIIHQADIIHIHDVFWWFIPYLTQKRYYITFHGYEGSEAPRWQAVVQRKIAEKASLGSLCVGDFMRRWYYANPTVVTYGAANLSPLPYPSTPAAAFWGRFAEDTGVMMYLHAWKQLHLNMPLRMYGEGPQTREVTAMAQTDTRLELHPWNESVRDILNQCRYAFVSRYLSIIEAMQSKRLVLAVYHNAIKQDYLTCHPAAKHMIIAGSSKELADRFHALRPAEESAMIENAYQWARHQTWESLTNTYLHLWQIN